MKHCAAAMILGVTFAMTAHAQQPLLPAVEVQETVYTYEPADNGAGPMWCYGSTCIARIGDDVFVSGLETLKDQKPLNNTRWMLFRRGERGWELMQADPTGRTREGCPIGAFPDGRLFISANPTLTEPGAYNGPAQPQVLQFSAASPMDPPQVLLPAWEGSPGFTEHSYRGFAADGPARELLLLNILLHEAQHWSFRDREGNWSRCGRLVFPMGVDYEVPEPIRLCYPVVALKNRAAHVMAISDIIEPVKAWREYKLELNNGRTWDYDFRRLFYVWTPDIASEPFSEWIEIASREKTAGHITNLDISVDQSGRAHLLWLDQSVWNPKVRDKFFPEVPITYSLETCVVDRGQVVQRTTIAEGGEGKSSVIPGYARFQKTPDGRLFVFYYCSGADETGKGIAENRVVELLPDGTVGTPVRVPLQAPFTSFMTATERGGSPPSDVLEVLGQASGMPGLTYARINLLSKVRADFTWMARQSEAGAVLELDAKPSVAAAGEIAECTWDIGGQRATGQQVQHALAKSGPVTVTLTVRDADGNEASAKRTVQMPPTPGDFGLAKWGLVLRTECEGFVDQGGGDIQVRNDKLNASGLSLSHWNTQDHWLEWELDIPQEGEYFLVARYATPENAARVLSVDGKEATMQFPSSGGYGSQGADNWAYSSLRGEGGEPVAVRLGAGRHAVRLRNPDGTGLNLDYLDWVSKTGESGHAPGYRMIDENGYRYGLPLRGTLVPGKITGELGHCYTYPLGPRYPGDGVPGGPASTLRLYEDGKELGPAHAPHVDVREKGNGHYSHWVTGLWFSTSDNSDPRTNGRKYTWEIAE